MLFPWGRYWRRVGVIWVIAFVVALAFGATVTRSIDAGSVLIAAVNAIVLAVIVAFPLTRKIYRGEGG